MTLATGDLTTLAVAKAYMNSPPSDAVLGGLITRISRTILGTINRPLLVPKSYTQQFNAQGTQALVLPNWPVLSIASLAISGQAISIAPQISDTVSSGVPYGYRYQAWDGLPPGNPAVLELVGGAWYYGEGQSVVVAYTAGYRVTGEVPTAATYTPATPYGIWATDEGVTYASSGTALVATTGTTPGVGRYVPPNPVAATPVLNYYFNAADITSGLLVNYGYIPGEIEQACIELVSERASYRNRIGVRSQSLASQESIGYNDSGISAYIRSTLGDYVSVLPPAIGADV